MAQDCLPTYKGVKYNNLSEIKKAIFKDRELEVFLNALANLPEWKKLAITSPSLYKYADIAIVTDSKQIGIINKMREEVNLDNIVSIDISDKLENRVASLFNYLYNSQIIKEIC